MRQVARVLERDPQAERVALGARLREQLVHVGDAHVDACLLEMRAAAGRVDGDGVDAGGSEPLAERTRPPPSLLPLARMKMERTAARLIRRRDDLEALRGQHTRSGDVHVAEDDALHAAREQPDPSS